MLTKLKTLASIYLNMAKVNFQTSRKLKELKMIYQPLIIRKSTTDEHVFQQIFLYDDYEIGQLNFKPKTIIDAGSYVGYASIFFNYKYPEARIAAIEPSSANFGTLQQNTQNIPSITRYKAGLWHKEAKIKVVDRKTGNWGFMIEEVGPDEKFDLETITVQKIMLDKGWDEIDIFKIDIEGSELELFTYNYEEWISKVKIFIIEFHDRIKPGTTDAFYNAIKGLKFNQIQRGENLIFIKEGVLLG